MRKSNHDGYIGLTIGILISVLILGFMFAFWYTSDTSNDSADNSLQPKNVDGTAPKTKMEEYNADIDVAKSVQDIVNDSNKKINNNIEQ